MKQSVCLTAAMALFLAAAGVIETHTGWSAVLLALMVVPMLIGRLDKRRVTAKEVERRYGNQ